MAEEEALKPEDVLDFGDKDKGMVKMVLYGTMYTISPTKELHKIVTAMRQAVLKEGGNPDDASAVKMYHQAEAAGAWIKNLTGNDSSYEQSLAVFNALDRKAQERCDSFNLGPNSPIGSESALGPSQSESETT